MPEQKKPFVVTDRRKFALDGTPRPDADPSPEREPRETSAPTPPSAPEPSAAAKPAAAPPLEFKSPHAASAEPNPSSAPESPSAAAASAAGESEPGDFPPPPTAIEMEQANNAYQQTADRLDTAVRAANPGMDHPPVMSFEQIVQSIYMTAIMQLGGATPEGQQPKVDLMGARQSIDMLGILAEKTKGNLSTAESQLMDNALFEVRMGFLEVTQALARSAATRTGQPGATGPSIVR